MAKPTGGARHQSPEIHRWLEDYRPRSVDSLAWEQVRPVICEWASRLDPVERNKLGRLLGLLARLAVWAGNQGLPLDAEVVLDPDTVERFVTETVPHDRSRVDLPLRSAPARNGHHPGCSLGIATGGKGTAPGSRSVHARRDQPAPSRRPRPGDPASPKSRPDSHCAGCRSRSGRTVGRQGHRRRRPSSGLGRRSQGRRTVRTPGAGHTQLGVGGPGPGCGCG